MPGLGVLALGDSITNGGGELQWGVALQSWALWTARGLGLPYTGHAVDGATIDGVLSVQIPRHEAAHPAAPYDVGCLYVGANDVRAASWDPAAFAAGHARALAWLAARAERLLTVTVPLDLGRPRAGAAVVEANAAIEHSAREHGALVVDLRGMRARNHLMPDRVHPTAFGQIAIAERALGVLAADGLPVRVRPSSLIAYQTTRRGRLRGDATYVYRSVKHAARGAWARRVNRT